MDCILLILYLMGLIMMTSLMGKKSLILTREHVLLIVRMRRKVFRRRSL
ncbi:unnamed protein product [Arabidopsis halleri]